MLPQNMRRRSSGVHTIIWDKYLEIIFSLPKRDIFRSFSGRISLFVGLVLSLTGHPIGDDLPILFFEFIPKTNFARGQIRRKFNIFVDAVQIFWKGDFPPPHLGDGSSYRVQIGQDCTSGGSSPNCDKTPTIRSHRGCSVKRLVYYFTKNRMQHIKMQWALYIKQNSLYNQVETNTPMNCLQLTYSYSYREKSNFGDLCFVSWL